MLEIKDLTFGYRKNLNVLEDFSLTFREGGIYGLLGKNGTGKSTLLYLAMGLLHPQKGEVIYNGIDTRLRRPESLGDMFIVPEEYNLPSIRLEEYLKVVRPFYPRFSNEILEKCLAGFGMSKDVHLAALSMGQKKKIYMCIALAANTRLLLMDEPTNGLDIPSKSQFRKVVASGMTDDKTIIISTHQVRDVELLLDHLCIIEPNRVLLDAPMARVADRLRFLEVGVGEAPSDVIYAEQGLQGYNIVAPRGDAAETPVNLELLFNALLANAEGVQKIITPNS